MGDRVIGDLSKYLINNQYLAKTGAAEGTRTPDPIITNFGGDLLEGASAGPSTLANTLV